MDTYSSVKKLVYKLTVPANEGDASNPILTNPQFGKDILDFIITEIDFPTLHVHLYDANGVVTHTAVINHDDLYTTEAVGSDSFRVITAYTIRDYLQMQYPGFVAPSAFYVRFEFVVYDTTSSVATSRVVVITHLSSEQGTFQNIANSFTPIPGIINSLLNGTLGDLPTPPNLLGNAV